MFKRLTITLLALTVIASGMGAAADLHDPTRPDTAVVAPPGVPVARFVVSAIFVSDLRRVAIVNGKAVTTGDRISGATVHAIDARTVKLRYRDKIIQTHLNLAKVRE